MKRQARPHEIPELLAPAGGLEAFRAAVANGADAVYLGLSELNARRSAANFTVETLTDACVFAHLRGVRVYLTANVLILPREMDDALAMIGAAWAAGVDAVIVQDLGLLRALRVVLPEVRIHASTQFNSHSIPTVRALARRGISRVTLARETSLREIAAIASAAAEEGVEIESFVHGALCVCYSGNCLLSSLIGGRSANRGRCAQPCRLPYALVDASGGSLSDAGAYLLSPRDLAGIGQLPNLIATGVTSLKIEGRMKSAEYVALVTGVYRAALDRAARLGEGFEVRDGEISVLSEAFSRGFTEAYLVHRRGNEVMSYQRPSNRGVSVGRIASIANRVATLNTDVALDSEDTLEVWTSRGRFAQRVGSMESGGVQQTVAPAGTRIGVTLEQPAHPGDRVFRVRNEALITAARRTFVETAGPAIPLAFSARVVIDEPITVTVKDEKGRAGEARGPLVEAARTRAVSADEVAEHVGRLGGTPYEMSSFDLVLSPSAGIGFSTLHRVRREALAEWERTALEPWRRAGHVDTPRAPRLKAVPAVPARTRLVAVVADVQTAHVALDSGADEAHVPVWALSDGDLHPRQEIVPLIPRVAHDAELKRYLAIAAAYPKVVAGSIGALAELKATGICVEAHWSLNALNAHSVAELADIGAGFVWLSPELSAAQTRDLVTAAPVGTGMAIAGAQELMVTEHCVLMSEGECDQACARCTRRGRRTFLSDRKGYRFPIVTDPAGRTHVYNAVPLDLISRLPDVLATGIRAVRVDAELLSSKETESLIERARRALERPASSPAGDDRGARPSRESTTTGHFFRGVD